MKKDMFTINKNGLSYGRGYVYSLQYHLVWCTKYRKKVLKDGIDVECKEMLESLAQEYKFQILAMEVMPDHIHLLVDCRPQFYISDMIKIMKGNLARQMFLLYPELKKELWGGHLWNPSYCAVTVSDRSREQVFAYIEGQKEKSVKTRRKKRMKIISSYGVELRKQNIPIRQTLEIYRSAVRYLVEVYESVWEELVKIEESKKRFNAAEHLVHTTKRNPTGLILISAFPRCHPISDGRQSSMRLGVYLLIRRVWNSGKQRDRKQESRI